MSLAGTSLGLLLVWFGSSPGPLVMMSAVALVLVGLAYVFTRPTL